MKKENDDLIKKHEEDLVKYLYQCLLTEGSKILLFTIIFNLIGWQNEYYVSLLFLLLLRISSGGIHLQHYISCFFLSFFILLINIFLSQTIHIPIIVSLILLLLCCFPGCQIVPVISSNRPNLTSTLKKKCKRKTLIILFIQIILLILYPDNYYVNIGTWTITTHFGQLLIANIKQGRLKHE